MHILRREFLVLFLRHIGDLTKWCSVVTVHVRDMGSKTVSVLRGESIFGRALPAVKVVGTVESTGDGSREPHCVNISPIDSKKCTECTKGMANNLLFSRVL